MLSFARGYKCSLPAQGEEASPDLEGSKAREKKGKISILRKGSNRGLEEREASVSNNNSPVSKDKNLSTRRNFTGLTPIKLYSLSKKASESPKKPVVIQKCVSLSIDKFANLMSPGSTDQMCSLEEMCLESPQRMGKLKVISRRGEMRRDVIHSFATPSTKLYSIVTSDP